MCKCTILKESQDLLNRIFSTKNMFVIVFKILEVSLSRSYSCRLTSCLIASNVDGKDKGRQGIYVRRNC